MFDKNKGWSDIVLHLKINNSDAELAQVFDSFGFDANHIGDCLDDILSGYIWSKHEEKSGVLYEIHSYHYTIACVKKILRGVAGPLKQAFENQKTNSDEKL